jgi:small GTP-binding protein
MKSYVKKVVLLGDSAVGKTSLIRKFVEDQFDDSYISTVGTKTSKKTVKIDFRKESVEIVLMIWDVIGAQGYSSTQAKHIAGADCAILVSDLTRPETLKGLADYWIPLLRRISSGVLPPIIFLSNKLDIYSGALPKKEGIASALLSLDPDGAVAKNPMAISWYPTSAKIGDNVEKAFEIASWMMLANNWEKDDLMDDMDGLVADEIFWADEIDTIVALVDRLFIDFEALVGQELSNSLLQKAFKDENVSNQKPTYDGMVKIIKSTARMAAEHGIDEEKAKAYQRKWLAWLETIM